MLADTYLAYADGSCLGNPGPGGWGVVIIAPDGAEAEYAGSEPRTTNNRMELTAALEALRHLPDRVRVTLRSDSEYLVKSINLRWRRNANTDLWKELDTELARREVKLEWVRGHADDPLNHRVDRLALEQAKLVAKGTGAGNLPSRRRESESTSASEAEILGSLKPLLAAPEQLRRCKNCGAWFVAQSQTDFCDHIDCQLKARIH